MNTATGHYLAGALTAANNLIQVVLEEDPTNLPCYSLKITILCKSITDLEDLSKQIKETFYNAIENTSNFKEENNRNIFMNMIYCIASISTELAVDCANLLKPSMWPRKNIAFDSFMIAKLYLLTLGNINIDTAEGFIQTHIQEIDGEISISQTTEEACQLVLWQAGDRCAKEKKWKDAIICYKSSLLLCSQNTADSANTRNKLLNLTFSRPLPQTFALPFLP